MIAVQELPRDDSGLLYVGRITWVVDAYDERLANALVPVPVPQESENTK